MTQQFQAIYDHGVLRLDQPLMLPDQTRVSGTVVQAALTSHESEKASLSVDEFDRLLDELSTDVPLLPPDFSRADVYVDHD